MLNVLFALVSLLITAALLQVYIFQGKNETSSSSGENNKNHAMKGTTSFSVFQRVYWLVYLLAMGIFLMISSLDINQVL